MKAIIVPRIERDGTPILFFPSDRVNPGMIGCYVHIGQHSEASLDYFYKDTRPARNGECDALIHEWDELGGEWAIVPFVIRQRIRRVSA